MGRVCLLGMGFSIIFWEVFISSGSWGLDGSKSATVSGPLRRPRSDFLKFILFYFFSGALEHEGAK